MNNTTFTTDNHSPLKSARISLRIAGVSAILASICYLGPFLLIAYSLSSSWILFLITLSEWPRPFFILVALVALFFAYQRIWHPASAYKSGQICAIPQVKMTYKVYFLAVAMLAVVVLMLPYVAPEIHSMVLLVILCGTTRVD